MGLFDMFKKKPEAPVFPVSVAACTAGKVVAMADIPDEVFSQGILGPCVGINPVDGKVYAPFDCKVTQTTETLHAIGMEGPGGVEVLVHCGLDTVAMNGEGFVNHVAEGQNIQKGDLILTMDLDKVRAAGHPTTVITIVTNSDDFAAVDVVAGAEVATGDPLVQVKK